LQVDHLPEGTQLRLARIAAGLTLFDVGMRASVSPPRLSEFERGRGSLAPEAVARVYAVLRRANRCQGKGAGRAPAL
jgi:transcriptional regulator with XRE-family HTH domain